jgi:hypothetical protein
VFTSLQELIVFKVTGSQPNSSKKIFSILARKGLSTCPTYLVDDTFSSAIADSEIGVLQLSPGGWERFKVKFQGDLTVSRSLDPVQIRPAIVSPPPVTAHQSRAAALSNSLATKYPETAHRLFHAPNPQEAPPTDLIAESQGQSFKLTLASTDSVPGNAFALHKYGLEPNSLDVLSVNPIGTMKQSARSVCRAFWATRQCAVPFQLVTSFVSSWHWHRDLPITATVIIAAFTSLSGIVSPILANNINIHLQRFYCESEWSEQTRNNFGTWIRGQVLPLIHDFFHQGRAAMENFILLLSMLFNLRFKVQDALLRALYRSQEWVKSHIDMLGVSSVQAQNLTIFSFVQLADDFHSAISQAPAMSRSATDAWLATIETIPQTHTHSLRELHFTQAFDRYVKTLSANALLQDNY